MISKVLVLAPHTDDGELACGATIFKMIRMGIDVYYVAFSSCKDSIPDGYSSNVLSSELYNATKILGIKKENVVLFDFPVRKFQSYRQEILEKLIELNKKILPDIIFSPSIHDIHQDHITIANECLRAYKNKTILQYEVPWNNFTFNNQLFVEICEDDLRHKLMAIHEYKSQLHRSYTKAEFITGLLVAHGIQAGCTYAEVFEAPRIIIKG